MNLKGNKRELARRFSDAEERVERTKDGYKSYELLAKSVEGEIIEAVLTSVDSHGLLLDVPRILDLRTRLLSYRQTLDDFSKKLEKEVEEYHEAKKDYEG